jgi:hypothetical protein
MLDLRALLPFRLRVYSPKLLNQCRSDLALGPSLKAVSLLVFEELYLLEYNAVESQVNFQRTTRRYITDDRTLRKPPL